MPKYTVCTPVKHDGKRYAVGASIDLTKADAEALPEGTVEQPRAEDAAARKAAEKAQKAEADRLAAEQVEAARKAQEEAEAAQKAEADRLAAEQAGGGNGGTQG